MNEKLNNYGLSVFKVTLTIVLAAIGLLSMIFVAFTTNELFSYFYCITTAFFVALPLTLSIIFKWKMNLFFYILFSFYAFGPLLGAVYNFYYFTSWWDILLHSLAGFVFAVVGTQLSYVLNEKNNTSYIMASIFGVLVSIVIAVLWEFFEYGCDTFFSSDMQADTIINVINTKINRTDGITDVITNISDTVVNGQSLGIKGYLDIGLIDTMHDMIDETLGALVFFVYAVFDKNRNPMIKKIKK